MQMLENKLFFDTIKTNFSSFVARRSSINILVAGVSGILPEINPGPVSGETPETQVR
jgi:hypothetical protein